MSELPGRRYTVESGIPIPEDARHENPELYEAVSTMRIGDSILLDYTRHPIASNLARATGFKFTQRKVGKDKMRLWRIK